MQRQVGPLKFGRDGLAKRGVLVRHLVMPGQEDEAAAIFGWLAREVSPDTYVNIMGQYRPEFQGARWRTGRRLYRDQPQPQRRRWKQPTTRLETPDVAVRRAQDGDATVWWVTGALAPEAPAGPCAGGMMETPSVRA
jgi:hypothetical protein